MHIATLCICWPVQADAEPRAQHRPHHRRQSQRHRPPHHQAPAAHRSRPGAHANLDGEEARAPRPTTSRTADPPPPWCVNFAPGSSHARARASRPAPGHAVD